MITNDHVSFFAVIFDRRLLLIAYSGQMITEKVYQVFCPNSDEY